MTPLPREGPRDYPPSIYDPYGIVTQREHERRMRDLEKRFEGTNVATFTVNDESGSFFFSNAWPAHHDYELMEVSVADPDGDLDAVVMVYANGSDILSTPVDLDGNAVAFGTPDLITEISRGDYLQVELLSGYMYAGTINVRARRLA